MIRLTNIKRINRKENYRMPIGRQLNIYRVLAIMQIDDLHKLYSPGDVIRLGWCPKTQKKQYDDQTRLLSSLAQSRGIYNCSDHKDKNGEPLRPAMWTGYSWQERTDESAKYEAADIMDQALCLRDADIKAGKIDHSYWYDIDRGVLSVSPSELDKFTEISNERYLEEKTGKPKTKRAKLNNHPPNMEIISEVLKEEIQLAFSNNGAVQENFMTDLLAGQFQNLVNEVNSSIDSSLLAEKIAESLKDEKQKNDAPHDVIKREYFFRQWTVCSSKFVSSMAIIIILFLTGVKIRESENLDSSTQVTTVDLPRFSDYVKQATLKPKNKFPQVQPPDSLGWNQALRESGPVGFLALLNRPASP